MLHFGNREINKGDVIRFCQVAGAVSETNEGPDTLFVRFTKATYTRAEVLDLLRLLAEMQPDECTLEGDGNELRLWWD